MVYLYKQLEMLATNEQVTSPLVTPSNPTSPPESEDGDSTCAEATAETDEAVAYVDEPKESIFQKTQEKSASYNFELKEGIEFHLFITTSPCGDARIFSLHENTSKEKTEEKDEAEETKDEEAEIAKNEDDIGRDEVKSPAESIKDEVESTRDSEKDNSETESIRDEGLSTRQSSVETLFTAPDQSDQLFDAVVLNENDYVVLDENNNVEEDIPVGDLSDNETDNDNPDNVVEPVSTLRVIPKISITDNDTTEEEQEAKKLKARERVKQTDSSKGMLRSKIECGMGTVPFGNKVHLQTWDGVMSGDRLLTMACSDKILRWNVVGIQGALLTHLIKPVYLSSITVGSKFHPGHMKRALYERIQRQVCDLPRPYNLRIPI